MPRGVYNRKEKDERIEVEEKPVEVKKEPVNEQSKEYRSSKSCGSCGHSRTVHYGSLHHQCNTRGCECDVYK